MKTMKRLLFFSIMVLLLFASCRKTCRCYRYDGNTDEYNVDELTENHTSCSEMEELNYGLTYSLCELVF